MKHFWLVYGLGNVFGFMLCLFTLGFPMVSAWVRRRRVGVINPAERVCPACGNAGCTLKTAVRRSEAGALLEVVVERTCRTCGAIAAEPPVLDKEKWLA